MPSSAIQSILHSQLNANGDKHIPNPLPDKANLSRPQINMNIIPESSVLHYTDVGLSTELQRVLNRSALDPEASSAGDLLGPNRSLLLSQLNSVVQSPGDDFQKQYLWLDKYHSQPDQDI